MMEISLSALSDTDQKRNIEDGEKSQLGESCMVRDGMGMNHLKITGEYGPYRQSERKKSYQPWIDQLKQWNAYKCYYSKKN